MLLHNPAPLLAWWQASINSNKAVPFRHSELLLVQLYGAVLFDTLIKTGLLKRQRRRSVVGNYQMYYDVAKHLEVEAGNAKVRQAHHTRDGH